MPSQDINLTNFYLARYFRTLSKNVKEQPANVGTV